MRTKLYVALAIAIGLVAGASPFGSAARAVVIAETGFNDASGINADGAANSPYELGAAIVGNGAVEPGWDGAWTVVSGSGSVDRGSVTTVTVLEGDGALRHASALGTAGANDSSFRRVLAAPLTGTVRVDYNVRIEAMFGTRDWVLYTGEASGASVSAASMIRIWHDDENGGTQNLHVYNGNGIGGIVSVDTGVNLALDTWYKLTAEIDTVAKSWDLYLDDAPLMQDIGFRVNTAGDNLNAVQSWLTRGNSGTETTDAQITYLDSIVITQVPEPSAILLAGCGLLGATLLVRRSRRREV